LVMLMVSLLKSVISLWVDKWYETSLILCDFVLDSF
jgi:hypothetical protein